MNNKLFDPREVEPRGIPPSRSAFSKLREEQSPPFYYTNIVLE